MKYSYVNQLFKSGLKLYCHILSYESAIKGDNSMFLGLQFQVQTLLKPLKTVKNNEFSHYNLSMT